MLFLGVSAPDSQYLLPKTKANFHEVPFDIGQIQRESKGTASRCLGVKSVRMGDAGAGNPDKET